MKSYKIKQFHDSSKNIDGQSLKQTLDDFMSLDDNGKNRYSLGANLFKLRVATGGKGKSGGSRTIIVFKKDSICYWVHCFQKKDKENLTTKELKDFKKLSIVLLSFNDGDILELINQKYLYEV